MEIQAIFTEQPDIYGVYGFGSFFRREKYKDIDLLLVATERCKSALEVFYQTKKVLDSLSSKLGVEIDITFLTYAEYLGKPLMESDNLTILYEK